MPETYKAEVIADAIARITIAVRTIDLALFAVLDFMDYSKKCRVLI